LTIICAHFYGSLQLNPVHFSKPKSYLPIKDVQDMVWKFMISNNIMNLLPAHKLSNPHGRHGTGQTGSINCSRYLASSEMEERTLTRREISRILSSPFKHYILIIVKKDSAKQE
jgi:hypothetical protein